MKKMKQISNMVLGLLLCSPVYMAHAGDVQILSAEFSKSSGNQWTVNVTLKHADAGWKHYADNWRVVDAQGNVLGDRVLYHPHVNEQPFTRSLGGVKVPSGIETVYIEAHDKVHGWTKQHLEIDLTKAKNGQLKVKAAE